MIFKPGWVRDVFDNRDKKYKVPLMKRYFPVPNIVDMRQKTRIKNQDNYGFCVSFGVSGVYELASPIKGWLDSSELFVQYNAQYLEGTNGEDAGAQIRNGMKAIARWGTCSEAMLPYNSPNPYGEPSSACYREAKRHKALVYEKIDPNINDMKRVLASGFGIVMGLYLYSSFFSDKTSRTGFIQTPNTEAENFEGGHCIYLCGYISDLEVFILVNSWGDEVGDKGYYYLPFSYATNDAIALDRWTITRVEL